MLDVFGFQKFVTKRFAHVHQNSTTTLFTAGEGGLLDMFSNNVAELQQMMAWR